MGPLKGTKIVEMAGIGPAPMCAMLLADLGATVLRIDRSQPVELGYSRPLEYDLLLRNRHRIALVDTRTDTPAPGRTIRFQYGNHLGSASLELDEHAAIVA